MLDISEFYRQRAKGLWRQPWVQAVVIPILRRLLKEQEINEFLAKHKDLPTKDFIGEVFSYFSMTYECNLVTDAQFPVTGRAIIVANHPLGGWDGLALLHAVLSFRSDVKVVVNQVLESISPLTPHVLPIDNMKKKDFSRTRGRMLRATLNSEEALILFPAGEVSRKRRGKIQDGPWMKTAVTLARSCNTPIIPVYIGGENSTFFYRTSRYAPQVSTMLLPREMWRQKKPISLTFGRAIPASMVSNKPVSDKQIAQLLREHTYRIKHDLVNIFDTPCEIAQPLPETVIQKALQNDTKVIAHIGDEYQIRLYNVMRNSTLLHEIGRLREISFRQIGAGAGSSRDIDQYDAYYHQLILFSEKHHAIIGGYRLFQSKDAKLTNQLSKLYTTTQFKYYGDISWLEQGLEMGRSFIVPEYWHTRALDSLWRGIGAYCKLNPSVRYLFGGVSIPSNYPKEVLDCLVAFYQTFFASSHIQARAKIPYVGRNQSRWQSIFSQNTQKEAEQTLAQYCQKWSVSIPPLFKHYANLCTPGGVTFCDFAVDPEFGFTLDALVVIDLEKLESKKRIRYMSV